MPDYTKEDMKKLEEMSEPYSISRAFLEYLDYDPGKFKELLLKHGLKKDVYDLFERPLDDIPLIVNDKTKSGYLLFRATISK